MKAVDKELMDFLVKQPFVTLGFSTGKDSVACMNIVKRAGVKVYPFYFYMHPELEFIDKSIKMYEDIFETEVIRLPHPMLYDFLRHQDFQPPKMIEYLGNIDFPKLFFDDLVYTHLESIGENVEDDYFDIVGMRASESFRRRMYFNDIGAINYDRNKIFIIWNWHNQDVYDYLEAEHIPLTEDYKLWKRSYDVLSYRFLFGVRDHYPEDYKRLKELYPLLDLDLFRYEKNRIYF